MKAIVKLRIPGWTRNQPAPGRLYSYADRSDVQPTVAVNGGRVAVTYYDSRNLQPGQTANWPTDYWAEYSTDGGATWGGEQHIAGPFDLSTAPVARGFFLGDYEGLAAKGTSFGTPTTRSCVASTCPVAE